jgi:3-hydroxyacyl-CoA dehydrogenase
MKRPKRVLGLHFFYPPVIAARVEVARGEHLAPAMVEAGLSFLRAPGKTPVVGRDMPASSPIAARARFTTQPCGCPASWYWEP